MASGRERAPRWNDLLGLLAERGRLTVTDACGLLDVSPATVRRDFNDLAAKQLVTRTHGGVVANAIAYDLPARYKAAPAGSPRERVAHRAAQLVRIGGVVGFNGGTTTTATARHLLARPDVASSSTREPTTIVTNALNIATEMVLRPAVRCVTLGGVARAESYEQTGSLAIQVMEQLWLDLLILGVGGIDGAAGATCRHEDEAGINSTMVARSDHVVVVATGDKLGRTTFARICGIEAITTLVTDASAPAHAVEKLREAGVDVVIADGLESAETVESR